MPDNIKIYAKDRIIGNLGKNPTEKVFENGKIAEFSVGVTERERTLKNGKTIPASTEWFNCIARNGLADVIMNNAAKGHKVWIEAKMRTRKYTDKNGVDRE